MKRQKHRLHITRRTFTMLVGAAVAALVLIVVISAAVGPDKVSITGSTTTYYIDKEQYEFRTEPYLCDATIYLPVEDILTPYEYTFSWDESTSNLTISNGKNDTIMGKDSNTLIRGNKTYSFNLPTMRRGGVMYMPSEMFEYFSKDELVFDGDFKFVERPYRDLMENTAIDDSHRIEGNIVNYGGVYVVDDRAAMELLYYPEDNCKAYADVINSIAKALPDVQVYDVAIPSMTEFYGPENLYTDQIEGIRTIYQNLDETVMPVNVIKEMWPHADEHLYFSTDHHWTQRGAYYAYRAFIKAKGEEIADISVFPTKNVNGFIGSWMNNLKGSAGEYALTTNPETLERFMPVVDYSGEIYLDMKMSKKWRDSDVINLKDDKYTTFIGGDMPLIKYQTSVKNGEKVVIIKDSFGNAFATWAVNNYEEVYIIDPRSWNGFNPSSDHGTFDLVKFYNDVCKFDDLVVVSYPGSASSGMRKAISALIGK